MKHLALVDLSIPRDDPLHDEILAIVSDVMTSGRALLGRHLKSFESHLAASCGVAHAVGLASGTDALVLALRALGIGRGDEVITPGNVFCAVPNAVLLAGATPIFCDVSYDDLLMDMGHLEDLITPRTRAVIALHLTGLPCDMDELSAIAERHGLAIVEDAAQAIGASYRGRKVGALGTIGCFSFHPNKNIRALGDGGAAVTEDESLATALRELRNHGIRSGEVVRLGVNSRLDEVQAAIIDRQLDQIDAVIDKKRRLAMRYRQGLAPYTPIGDEPPHKRSVYQQLVIKTPRRDALHQYLHERDIESGLSLTSYPPFQPLYTNLYGHPTQLPVTERLAREVLSLPIHQNMELDDVDRVVAAVASFFSG